MGELKRKQPIPPHIEARLRVRVAQRASALAMLSGLNEEDEGTGQ